MHAVARLALNPRHHEHPDLVGEDGARGREELPARRRQRSRRHADGRNHHAIGRRGSRTGDDAGDDGIDHRLAGPHAATAHDDLRDSSAKSGCRASFARRGQALRSHPTGSRDDEPRSLRRPIVDQERRRSAVERLRRSPRVRCRRGGSSPSPIALLADIGRRTRRMSDPDAPDPANLWRVHWFNDADRERPRRRARARRAAARS